MRSFILITLALLLMACGGGKYPEDQRLFSSAHTEHNALYQDAQGNDLQQNAIKADRDSLLKKDYPAGYTAQQWSGSVEKVSEFLGDVHLDIEAKGIEYKAQFPKESHLVDAAKSLMPGEEVIFSGTLSKETSFTDNGSMTEPEYFIKLSSLTKQ